MDKHTLWSLRLGYSNKQATIIKEMGLPNFLANSFEVKIDREIPKFLENSPKNLREYVQIRKDAKLQDHQFLIELQKKERQAFDDLNSWWIKKMSQSEFPLCEKMTCFWHNHFVASFHKIKVVNLVFQHNQILRDNAFGNFKTLTKKIVQSNATIYYLDNNDNKKGKLNENLSRELLELFTLGIGNYTEDDIKNGAKGLAGLSVGDEGAKYRALFEDNEIFSYFGKEGAFKIEDMIDIIFEQKNIPYLITRKILKWFIYDTPPEKLVRYYGNYFRKVNFEIKPLLTKIFLEEYAKNTAGSKIKNPLEFILQLMDELHIESNNEKNITNFIRTQGMELFNQPNVKGWNGGSYWLTSQIYLQRNNLVDSYCNRNLLKKGTTEPINSLKTTSINTMLDWIQNKDNKQIIFELKERLLFKISEKDQQDFEKILKYDFDSNSEGAKNGVLRLINFMAKSPEFQLI